MMEKKGVHHKCKSSKMLKKNPFPRASQHSNRRGNHSSTPTSYYMKDTDCRWEGCLYFSRPKGTGELLLFPMSQ